MHGFSPTVRTATCAWALDAQPYVLTPCPLDGILTQLVPFVERLKWASDQLRLAYERGAMPPRLLIGGPEQ